MPKEIAKNYETMDFYETCFLVASGCDMKRIDIDENSGQCVFIFDSTDDISTALAEYRRRDCTVSVHAFVNKIKRVKSQMHEAINKDRVEHPNHRRF